MNRTEWLEARRSAVGASEVSAILGISPWSTPWEVWADKRGILDDWDGNAATKAGNTFESAVLDHAEQTLGPLERDVRIKADGLPLAATCDAITQDRKPVEAKTTGITGPVQGSWGDPLTDQIPDHYMVQVIAQMICTKADMGYLFALIAGRGVVEYRVERDERLLNLISGNVAAWWERHIIKGIEPSREQMPALDVVKRLKKVPSKTTVLPGSTSVLIDERERYKVIAKDTKKNLDRIEAEILLALGDAEAGDLPDGRQLTYMETERAGYTVQPTKYRTLRVRKAK